MTASASMAAADNEPEFDNPDVAGAHGRIAAGKALIWAASILFAAVLLVQSLYAVGAVGFGFANWRPVLYAYALWGIALGVGQVMARGSNSLDEVCDEG